MIGTHRTFKTPSISGWQKSKGERRLVLKQRPWSKQRWPTWAIKTESRILNDVSMYASLPISSTLRDYSNRWFVHSSILSNVSRIFQVFPASLYLHLTPGCRVSASSFQSLCTTLLWLVGVSGLY